jgi:hypothetical protein
VEPLAVEQVVIKAVRRAKLFVFLPPGRAGMFEQGERSPLPTQAARVALAPSVALPRAAAAQASSSGGISPIAARVRTSTEAPSRGAAAVTAGRAITGAAAASPARTVASHSGPLIADPPGGLRGSTAASQALPARQRPPPQTPDKRRISQPKFSRRSGIAPAV